MRDLARSKNRPRGVPSDSMIERAFERSSGEPQKVPSSRNQVLIRSPGTSSLILFTMDETRVRYTLP